jgi:hypothetical protein
MILRAAIVACLAIVFGCTDDAGPGVPTTNTPTLPTGLTNSFRVQGAGYVNATFRGFTADSASVAHDEADGALIGFSGLTPSNVVFSVAIDIPERRTGTFTFGNASPARMSMQIGTTSYVAADGMVEITMFSPGIGQVVTGAFSATMTPFPGPGDPISVSSGQFTIRRTVAP